MEQKGAGSVRGHGWIARLEVSRSRDRPATGASGQNVTSCSEPRMSNRSAASSRHRPEAGVRYIQPIPARPEAAVKNVFPVSRP